MNGPSLLALPAGEIAVWERDGAGPAVLLCHATGFHARCWDRVIANLHGRRCIALDMRGHGRSVKPPPPYSWRWFGEDTAEVCRRRGLRGAIGVGHSMGGHALVLAAAAVADAFSALLLIDPVIQPEQRYGEARYEPHFARKRRNHWHSPEQMFQRFAAREPFSKWDRAVLRDYCEYGLLPASDGNGCVLACPPEVEASIYEHSTMPEANIYPEVARVKSPVLVVRSVRKFEPGPVMDMSASPTAPDLAARFPNGRDLEVAWSHFVPMEAPEFTAGLIAALAAEHS